MLNVRLTALRTIVSILEDGAYANLSLKNAAQTTSAAEIPFLNALVNETIVRSSYADYILSYFCKRQKRLMRNLLRMSVTELLFLRTPNYAVVNEAVSLCRLIGKKDSTAFVNSVLRRIDRERDSLPPLPSDTVERLSVFYGLPSFLVREWINTYGEQEAEDLMSAAPVGTEVRAQYPFTTKQLIDALPIKVVQGKMDTNALRLTQSFDIEHSLLFANGSMTVQNEGAMMICRALGDVRGKRILDACAAPGGKAAYLSSLSCNTAEITAWELYPHRKELLDATLKRLHVSAKTACIDASELQEYLIGSFDAVLLDVPCSGFGLLADKPDVRLHKNNETIEALTKIQDQILHTCAQYVKPGGILVYATCTISKRENEERIKAFLDNHRAFALIDERQLLPTRDGTNGFYYAKMIGG